ncbi:MAG: hypothetical protein ACYDCN_16315 [Bacteroidia bacterium]
MKATFKIIVFVIICFLLDSCNTIKNNHYVSSILDKYNSKKINHHISENSYCAPPSPYVYDSTYLPLANIMPIVQYDSLLAVKYSYEDLLIANATGTLLLIQDLVHLEENKSVERIVYILTKKQQIFNRLLLASTEVASLAAELDCESERSKLLATYLDQLNDTRIQKFTILSVVTGAITGVATSRNSNSKAQVAIGITGSIISAVFGGLAVVSSRQAIVFNHRRNLLTDIWYESKTSSYYPPFIWFILQGKEFTNSKEHSTFYNLKERWIEEGMVDTTQKKQVELYFGEGGKYHANDLHTRTNMLNQLKAEVRSVNQHLQSLMLKLSV